MDCWFEVTVGWWSDWTCTVPILIVDALAVSASQPQVFVNRSVDAHLSYMYNEYMVMTMLQGARI
jgi:hypothetical protein